MAKKYFKHYEDAATSEFVQKVINEYGLLGYAHWMLLLELMVSKYNGKSILIRLTVQEVATKLRIKASRSHSVISQFSELSDNGVITKLESSDNQANFDGFIIIISAPILSDLQAKDFGRVRSARAKSEPRLKIKDLKIEDVKIEDSAPQIPDEIIPKVEVSNEVTTDRIINLFNGKLGGVGKIKHSPHFMPSPVLEDFKLLLGFKEFQNLETWENYFNLVSQSKFLTTEFTPTLAWLFKSENAFKVLGGQYQDRDEKIKSPEKIPDHLEANASNWAGHAYRKIRESDDWYGDTNFDCSILEHVGDLSLIRQSESRDKADVLKKLKTAYFKINPWKNTHTEAS